MNKTISKKDQLANIIHADYRVLMVLERMGIPLGFGNQTVEQAAEQYGIRPGAFVIILNLFCNESYLPKVDVEFDYIPDFLKYLSNSHQYFLHEKIPTIHKNIQQLVKHLHDSKAELVESFYQQYIEEVTEHIDYENETVFPFIEEIYEVFVHQRNPQLLLEEYDINIYDEHHDDIEDVLKDLKNILIRHLPQKEAGKTRMQVLQQLFELESDLSSHTRIEDEVLIPLVKKLEERIRPTSVEQS